MKEELERRYYNLKDRDLRKNGVFICEGRNLVLRLINSSWKIESVLCAPRFYSEFRKATRDICPIIELSNEEIYHIAGYKFHRGVMACGIRPIIPSIDELPTNLPHARTIVILPNLANQENVGGIIRSADALGADAVVLGNRCADPLGRKALKAAMGSTFSIPVFSCTEPRDVLPVLKKAEFTITGAIASGSAVPLPEFLCPRDRKTALCIGGEALGLPESWAAICDQIITIPMRPGVDSLNASVSAGIILYALCSNSGCPATCAHRHLNSHFPGFLV